MKYDTIQIAMIGGTADGKTTFFTSMIQTMSRSVLRLGNGHSLTLRPINMKKSLSYINENKETKEQEIVETKEISEDLFDDKYGFMAAMMSGEMPQQETNQNTQPDLNDELSADNTQSMVKLNHDIEKMFEFPSVGGTITEATQTNVYIKMTLELILDDKKICDLIIIDYAGEVVDYNRDNISELLIQNYAHQIDSCDAAIIFASSQKLSDVLADNPTQNDSIFNKTRAKQVLNVPKITNVLYNSKKNQPFTFMLAISQTENLSVAPRVKQNNFKDTERSLQTFIYDTLYMYAKMNKNKAGAPEPWATGMLPVDAFGPNCVTETNELLPDADINPIGVAQSILYCIYNVSLVYDGELKDKINSINVPFFKGRAEKLKEKSELQGFRDNYKALRQAIMSSENYFDDVYEMNYFENKGVSEEGIDHRFPKRKTVVVESAE